MQGRQEEKASGGNLINWEWGPETEPGAKARAISAFSYTALKPIPRSLRGWAPNGGAGESHRWGREREGEVR